jgi:hypothetical protein
VFGSPTRRLTTPVTAVSFADPQTLGFFTIWVNTATDRTLELNMTAAAHFMHDTYGQFDSAIAILVCV